MPQTTLSLTQIVSGATAAKDSRWSIFAFLDKAIILHPTITPKVWNGTGSATDLPGIVTSDLYEGGCAFQGHVVLWKGDQFVWSDLNDFTNFIPVTSTSSVGNYTTITDFTQPAIGANTSSIFVTEETSGVVVGGFVRISNDPYFSFYKVAAKSAIVGLQTTTPGFTQTLAPAATDKINLTARVAYVTGQYIGFMGDSSVLQVVSVSRNGGDDNALTAAFTAPAIGATSVVTLLNTPTQQIGDRVSFGALGLDIYEVTSVAAGAKQLTLKRIGVGSGQQASWSGTNTLLVVQPWVEVTNISTSVAIGIAGATVDERYSLTLTREDRIGAHPTATNIPAGTIIYSVVRNEAGALQNTGDRVNGAISAIVAMGDQAYILKRRSIQSIQYVGVDGGTFSIRPEILDEGTIGKYSWALGPQGIMFILGHQELYTYQGGKSLQPIATQVTRQLYAELDYTRLDDVFLFHDETRQELWVVYPTKTGNTTSPTKVLVYNYTEKSCVYDIWPANTDGISALATVDLVESPAWDAWTGPWTSDSLPWNSEGSGRERIVLAGLASLTPNPIETNAAPAPAIARWGHVYRHGNSPMTCTAETADMDFGDPLKFKYGELATIALDVKTALARPSVIKIQFGGRDNLDSDIRWTDLVKLDISGNSNYQAKVNIRKSGRYLRMRVYSDQLDVQWSISGYTLTARIGETY